LANNKQFSIIGGCTQGCGEKKKSEGAREIFSIVEHVDKNFESEGVHL